MGLKGKWRPVNTNPGPDHYNPNKEAVLEQNHSGIKYRNGGSQERLAFPNFASEQISAATYNVTKPFGHGALGKSMGRRLKDVHVQNNPAPG